MLGRTKLSLPVCSLSTAPPCAGLVPCSEWMKQRSSTCFATFGNRSLTGWPHFPYCLNFQGDRSRVPVLANVTRGRASGYGLPWSRSRSCFGSNVSIALGPPFMKRKMTRLALGSKWSLGETPGADVPGSPASARSEWSASAPNPRAECLNRWRRVRRVMSLHIHELVGGQHRLADQGPRFGAALRGVRLAALEVQFEPRRGVFRPLYFAGRRRAAVGDAVEVLGAGRVVLLPGQSVR